MTAEHAPARWKAVVSYDGTNYGGWQVQPGRITVQGKLEDAVEQLTRKRVRVHCSGRTDTGVHARGQVVHMDLDTRIKPHGMIEGLNRYLPDDIRVESARIMPSTFDARFSATGKEYRYFIWNGPVLPAWARLYRAHVRKPLDIAAMRDAASVLTGRHDFSSFCANPGHERDPVRTVNRITVSRRGPDITIRVDGEGFLYKMVRSLAGYLIRVGQGDLPVSSAHAFLQSRERTARVPTAPAKGLFLWRVRYGRR